jgi:alpha-1,2-mannosyltransferase
VRVRTVEAGSGQVEPSQPPPRGATDPQLRLGSSAVGLAAALLVLSVTVYVVELALSKHFRALTWYDLNIYNDGGLIARHQPGHLYTWHLPHYADIKFTYTPFAAVVFAVFSGLKLQVLHWLMTLASLAAIPVVASLTLRELGWRGQDRLAATLAVAAVVLWTEPVWRALQLGQIDLLMMLLIVWDLCQNDRRWWKGAGVGVAAAIYLIPLIFIPFLLLCGRIKQAVVAMVTGAVTIVLGFAVLPSASTHYWLTGYFLHAGNVGDVGSLENQSLLALMTRAMGGERLASPVWLPIVLLVGAAGLLAAAALYRSGQRVAGWVTCALVGLLVSPISWDHLWDWIVPILIVLIDRAVRARGPARWAWWAAAVALAGVYGEWPAHLSGKEAFVPYYGLISFFAGRHPLDEIYHLHGIQVISWNLFVVAGLVMLAVAVVAALRAWRQRKAGPAAEPAAQPAS